LRGAGAAVSTAVVIGTRRPSHAAEFSFKFAHGYPTVHPVNVYAEEAAKAVLDATKGRVEIKVFGNALLGGDTQMLSQVRSGAIQLFSTGGMFLSSLVRVASINGVGFAFRSYDSVWKAMDGKIGAMIRKGFADAKLHAFEKCWDSGFRQITSSTRPIVTPDDIRGFKIRVPVSPMMTSLFEGLKAAPTAINFPEVYSALQTKIVEGQENPLNLALTARFYEVQKYVSMTNHMWDGCWVLANGAAFAGLPEDLRKIVETCVNEAGVGQRVMTAKQNESVVDEMKRAGLAFNDVDSGPFQKVLQAAGFYDRWAKEFGSEAWDVLKSSSDLKLA
jgi:tripartite ATP-independent transporter DctP family solute receptor